MSETKREIELRKLIGENSVEIRNLRSRIRTLREHGESLEKERTTIIREREERKRKRQEKMEPVKMSFKVHDILAKVFKRQSKKDYSELSVNFLLGTNRKGVIDSCERLKRGGDGCERMSEITSGDLSKAYIKLAKMGKITDKIARISTEVSNKDRWSAGDGNGLIALSKQGISIISMCDGSMFHEKIEKKNGNTHYRRGEVVLV